MGRASQPAGDPRPGLPPRRYRPRVTLAATIAQSGPVAPSGTAGAILWVGIGMVVVMALGVVVLRLRRVLLGERRSDHAEASLAETLRTLRERGEINAADFARAQRRLLDRAGASPTRGARDGPTAPPRPDRPRPPKPR